MSPIKLRQACRFSFYQPPGTSYSTPAEGFVDGPSISALAVGTNPNVSGRVYTILIPLDKLVGASSTYPHSWGWQIHTYGSTLTNVTGSLDGINAFPRGWTEFVAKYSSYVVTAAKVETELSSNTAGTVSVWSGSVQMPAKVPSVATGVGWVRADYDALGDHVNAYENPFLKPELVGAYQILKKDRTYNVAKQRRIDSRDHDAWHSTQNLTGATLSDTPWTLNTVNPLTFAYSITNASYIQWTGVLDICITYYVLPRSQARGATIAYAAP